MGYAIWAEHGWTEKPDRFVLNFRRASCLCFRLSVKQRTFSLNAPAVSQTVTTQSNSTPRNSLTSFDRWPEMSTSASANAALI